MVQYTAHAVHLMHDINALCKSGARVILFYSVDVVGRPARRRGRLRRRRLLRRRRRRRRRRLFVS